MAERARVRRQALQMSFADVAALVDVTPPTIARWEAGDLPDSIRTNKLRAWEFALQAPAGWLLCPADKILPDPVEIARPVLAGVVSAEHVPIPASIRDDLASRALSRRKRLGLSRAQVSELCGASVATLIKWEQGVLPRTMRVERLSAWEAALEAPPGWLLDGQVAESPLPQSRQRVTVVADTMADAIREVAVCLATRGRNLGFPDRPLDATMQRNVDLFTCRYGVRGPSGTTLLALAAPYGITRERVRQIIESMIERSASFEFQIAIVDSLAQACTPLLPCPAAVLTEKLQPILGPSLSIEDACSFVNELLGKRIVRFSEATTQGPGPRIARIAYGPSDEDVVQADAIKAIRSVAYAMIRSCGVAHMPTVAGIASLSNRAESAGLAKMLQSVEGFEWLDGDRVWFWFGPGNPARNIILSIARKVFAVARERVDIADLMSAVMRYRSRAATSEFGQDRTLMLIPPIHVARAVLERIDWLEVVQHDDYRAASPLCISENLSETELRFVAELEKLGGVASRYELRTALSDIKLITFSMALMTTPIVRLVSRGIYALVGWPLNPSAFARAASPRAGMPNRIEVRINVDGSVSFPYVLTEFAVESKVCTIPAGAVPHVPAGAYRIHDSDAIVDCVNRTSGATTINRLVQELLVQGYDSGDVLRVKIDSASRSIALAPED